MTWYYEIVIGSVKKRGKLIPSDELFNFVLKYGKDNALFKSVFLYPEDKVDEINQKGNMSNIFCQRYAYWIPVDIDKGDNSDELTLNNARNVVNKLFSDGLSEDNIIIWFSGTGYHIDIHSGCFGIEAHEDYNFLIKQTITELVPFIDSSIYSRSSIIRAPFSINLKSNRYKIPLSIDEFFSLSYKDIHNMSQDISKVKEKMSWFFEKEAPNKYGEDELSEYVKINIPQVRQIGKVIEPEDIVSCISKMWKNGPIEGSRNQVVMRLASHFRRAGIPSEACKASLLYWNSKSLEEKIVLEKVEYVYNKGYQYGCNDKYLKENCSTRCQHYKHKDLELDLMSADDMQKELLLRLTTDYENEVIHLDRMLGLPSTSDCKVFPGELVTIFGPPGGNKSTIAQNIALGMDFTTGVPNENYQLPTTYFHSELAVWLQHRRNLQIVTGLSKSEITKENVSMLYRQHKKFMDHIKVCVKPTLLSMVERDINNASSKLFIIDYAEIIDIDGYPSLDAKAKIPIIMKKLGSLAVTKNCIIIMISQTNRTEAMAKAFSMYSGFGSGSIEKSSRKVIGISVPVDGQPGRELQMFKNKDGDLFKINLELHPSFRLLRM